MSGSTGVRRADESPFNVAAWSLARLVRTGSGSHHISVLLILLALLGG